MRKQAAFPNLCPGSEKGTMVCDRVAYRFLPPGGCASGVHSVAMHLACSGAAHEFADVGVDESAAEPAVIIVEQNVCVLQLSEGDQLDGWLAELKGQRCRDLKTSGDGACALHATFGKGHPTKHELWCPQPRDLLRALLSQPLDTIRSKVRPSHIHLVDTVVSSLWTDFVVPYVDDAKRRRPNEEDMFLQKLKSSPLWDRALQRVKANRVLQKQVDDRRVRCLRISASISKPALDRILRADMALQAGLMPPENLSSDN